MPTYEEYRSYLNVELASLALNYDQEDLDQLSFKFLTVRTLSEGYPKSYVDRFFKTFLTPADRLLMEMVDKGMLVPIEDYRKDSYGNPRIDQYELSEKGEKFLIDHFAKGANDDYTFGTDYTSKIAGKFLNIMNKMYADADYVRCYGSFGQNERTVVDGAYAHKKAIASIDGGIQVEKANALIQSVRDVELNKKEKMNLLNEGKNSILRLAAAHKSHGFLYKIFRYSSYKKESTAINNIKEMLVNKCGVSKETLDIYQTCAENQVSFAISGKTETMEIMNGRIAGGNTLSTSNVSKRLDEECQKKNSVEIKDVLEKICGGKMPKTSEKSIKALQSLQDVIPVTMDENFFNNIITNYYHAEANDKTYLLADIADRIADDYKKEIEQMSEIDNYAAKLRILNGDYDEYEDDEVDYLNESMLFEKGEIPDYPIREFIENTYNREMTFNKEPKIELYDEIVKVQKVNMLEPEKKNAEISNSEIEGVDKDIENISLDEPVNEPTMVETK